MYVCIAIMYVVFKVDSDVYVLVVWHEVSGCLSVSGGPLVQVKVATDL